KCSGFIHLFVGPALHGRHRLAEKFGDCYPPLQRLFRLFQLRHSLRLSFQGVSYSRTLEASFPMPVKIFSRRRLPSATTPTPKQLKCNVDSTRRLSIAYQYASCLMYGNKTPL